LPEIGITAGCNFAAVQVLLNVLWGLSRLMGPGSRNSGEHFKSFVRDCYPWSMEPVGGLSPRRGTKAMYDRFRINPSRHICVNASMDVELQNSSWLRLCS
jgi:hypothetical protein